HDGQARRRVADEPGRGRRRRNPEARGVARARRPQRPLFQRAARSARQRPGLRRRGAAPPAPAQPRARRPPGRGRGLIVPRFPRPVRIIEHTLIPLKDGTRLAAKIWLPADAEQDPVPAILEYLPYRKRDGTFERDALTHPYLAGHGYAGVRVDIRGSGESDGVLSDEYARQEQDDAL